MLPINQKENSKRIFQSGKLQLAGTKWEKMQEDVWYLAWLKKVKKFSKEESYDLWKPIFQQKYGLESDAFLIHSFNDRWETANKMQLTSQKQFVIYKEEIEALNRVVVPRWLKEGALLALGYVKSRSFIDEKKGMDLPEKDILALTSIKKRKKNLSLMKELKNAGLFEIVEDKKFDETFGEEYFVSVPHLLFEREEGESILKTNTLFDIITLLPLIKTTMICIRCGKEFEYGPKTKRVVCEECWQEETKRKTRERVRRLRNGCTQESRKTYIG